MTYQIKRDSEMSEHNLEKEKQGWSCSVCQWKWKTKPQTLCPGVPRYEWGHEIPAHLKTQTQIGKLGLKPAKGQKPEGCVYRQTKRDYCWLYDVRQTVHKKATPAQLAALEKARSLLYESITLADEDRGVLESYREGLIEVRPQYPDDDDASRRYRWNLTAVHLSDGDTYKPSTGAFTSHQRAIEYGKQVFDWIVANPKKIAWWGCHSDNRKDGGLGITLHRQTREYPMCELPYLEFRDELPKLEVMFIHSRGGDAIAAGWAEAVELPYILDRDGSIVVCDSCDEAVEAGWIPAWSIEEY